VLGNTEGTNSSRSSAHDRKPLGMTITETVGGARRGRLVTKPTSPDRINHRPSGGVGKRSTEGNNSCRGACLEGARQTGKGKTSQCQKLQRHEVPWGGRRHGGHPTCC